MICFDVEMATNKSLVCLCVNWPYFTGLLSTCKIQRNLAVK